MSLTSFFSGIQVGQSLGQTKLIMHYHIPLELSPIHIKKLVLSNAETLVEEGKRLQSQNFMGTLITTEGAYHWMPYSNFWMEGLKDIDFSKSIADIADEMFE